jgi:hypothetical protein
MEKRDGMRQKRGSGPYRISRMVDSTFIYLASVSKLRDRRAGGPVSLSL